MTISVAFVDDDKRCISSMRRIMRDCTVCKDWNLLFFTSPEEALSAVENMELTALIADEHMPSMSGHKLIRLASERSPSLITMLLSGNTDMDAPDLTVIEKPCRAEQLLEIINSRINAASKENLHE